MIFQFRAGDGQQYTAKYLSTHLKPAWRILYRQANGMHSSPQAVNTIENVATKVQWLMPAKLKQAMADELTVLRADTPPEISELQEMLLYHPANPKRAALPLSFAPGLSIDAEGNLQGIHPYRGVLASIIPLLVILAIAWFGRFVVPH